MNSISRLHGILVVASTIVRGLLGPRPRRIDRAARLAALPTRGLPLRAPVTIHWNDHQVPFIEAAHDEDLAVALGLVHAHLRLAQMEIMRLVAFGRVSEVAGPLAVELDRALRLFDFGRAVPHIIAALPDETRRWAQGFVDGINHHITHAPTLPYELRLLGVTPQPWTLRDLFTVSRLMCIDVSWIVWSRLLRARADMDPAAWAELWPHLLQDGVPPPDADMPDEQLLAQALRGGSNAAAIAGWRSASGGGVIASDPHLSVALPNLWLIAGMHSPGHHAVGLMLPGMPFIGIGRNPYIAWGGTSLHAASSELYDVSALPPEAFTERVEVLRVRGAGTRTVRLRESPFGPVVSDAPLLRADHPLALHWAGHGVSDEMTAMLALERAKDWDDFRAALAGFAIPGQNMIYAGTDGRVGQMLAAHLPRRPPDPPLDLAMRADAPWDRSNVVTGADLPAWVDPEAGFVASANDRPPNGEVPTGFFFAPPDRISRLRALLSRPACLTADDIRALHRDVVSPGALHLCRRLLRDLGAPPGTPAELRLWRHLNDWDGSYNSDSRGAAAFELLLGQLVPRLIPAARLSTYQAVWTVRALVVREIDATPPARLRAEIAAALRRAARRASARRSWGQLHRLGLRHTLAALPLLGRRFLFDHFPADGSNDTLNKTGHSLVRGPHTVRFGSCARHMSDLADPDANQFVLLGGQDGWLGSENFTDQVPLWRRGDYVRVPLRLETVRAEFAHKTVLTPG